LQALSQESNEYLDLRRKIDGVLQDLSEHIKGPMGGLMTDSVKLICSYVKLGYHARTALMELAEISKPK
jgi:hypothetical protein